MQVVPDEVRKCVFFLFYIAFDGSEKLAGTGFFVSVPFTNQQGQFIYLVTAKHVITGTENKTSDGRVYLRINTKNNSIGVIATELAAWQYHPEDDSIDAAILAWAPDQNTFDYKSIPITMVLNDEVRDTEQIGAGDDVFLTGLFSNHHGTKKNLPIIRIGNIALMPEEKVYTNSFGYIDAYLIEARSIGGLSGSPVFVYLSYMRERNGNIHFGQGPLFYWLGIMHGHWDINEGDSVDVQSMDIVGKSINMGIGIVVPATKVIEIINGEHFAKQREKIEKEYRTSLTHD
jgi:hypothetical protein